MIKRLCATTVFLLLFLAPVYGAETTASLADSFMASSDPSPVPDLLFQDGNGRAIKLQDFIKDTLKNRYVLLTVWATWCVPCRKELPSLDRLQAMMAPRNLTVLALAEDHDGAVLVPAYFRRHNIRSLGLYLDPEASAIRSLRLRAIPVSLLINPQGEEIGRVAARIDWSRADNVATLQRMIKR